MRYRKLDALGDYTLGTGADFLVDSPEAVAQAISTRLKLWRGEFFVNTADGTAHLEKVLGKRGRSPDVEIKQRILGTPGVTRITSFASSYDGTTRRLKITATVETQFGEIRITEDL